MFSWIYYHSFRRFVFVGVLIISFTVYSLPLRADWTDLIEFSPEVESVANIKELVKKLKKLKKNPDKREAYKLIRKMKKEIETISGQKLSFSKGMEEVEEQFRKKGIKISHSNFKAIAEEIKNDKHKKDKRSPPGEEVDVPAQVVVGVTVALCGVFLTVLPLPFCKETGVNLIYLGAGIAAPELCVKYDENQKKQKDQPRKYIYRYS